MKSLSRTLKELIAALEERLTGRYRPERYYMRGPGPKASAKSPGTKIGGEAADR